MKNLEFLMLLILASFVFWSCEKDPINTDFDMQSSELNEKKAHSSKLQNKVVNSESLKGNFIGNTHTRKLQIYTPPGYKKNGNHAYPVVYLLHGFPLSEKTFTNLNVWDEWLPSPIFYEGDPDFPAEGFRLWIDNLIEEELIEPMIIVMPNASTEPYGFSFYSNSDLNGNFEDFIVNDLVNYIDRHYNTIANSSGRAIIGHCQGGYAAVKFGLLHNDIFGTVASHTGELILDALFHPDFLYLLEQENQGEFTGPDPTKFFTNVLYAMSAAWSPNLNNPPFYVDLPLEFHADGHLYPVPEVIGNKWYPNDVFNLLDTFHEDFNSLKGIFIDVGTLDEIGTHLAYPYVIQKLDYYNINYTYAPYEGGHHNKLFERLANSLEFCSNSME